MSAVNLANVNIIDADGHVLDRDANLRKFIPEPYCRRRGSLLPSDVWDSSMYGKLDTPNPDLRPGCATWTPNISIFPCCFPPAASASPSYRKKITPRLFAAATTTGSPVSAPRARGSKESALVPFQDVDAAAKETQRAIGELGLAGVTVGTFGMKEHLGQPMYWPIYEQLEKFNVPLLVHNSRQGPAGEIRFDTFLFRHTIGRPFETLLDCAALVYGGVPEKFPKSAHRLSRMRLRLGALLDGPHGRRMGEAPSGSAALEEKTQRIYHRGNWFFAAEPEESTVPFCLEKVGEDVILFASDYPHWDGGFPYMTATVKGRKDISEPQKRKIMRDNAARLYGWH